MPPADRAADAAGRQGTAVDTEAADSAGAVDTGAGDMAGTAAAACAAASAEIGRAHV